MDEVKTGGEGREYLSYDMGRKRKKRTTESKECSFWKGGCRSQSPVLHVFGPAGEEALRLRRRQVTALISCVRHVTGIPQPTTRSTFTSIKPEQIC